MVNPVRGILVEVVAGLLLAVASYGCGGGGGGEGGGALPRPEVMRPEAMRPEVMQPPENLPELPVQQRTHGAQAPILDLGGTLHVGADVAPSSDQLRAAGAYNGAALSSGGVGDGVGADRVLEFLHKHVAGGLSEAGEGFTFGSETTGLPTFAGQPIIRVAGGTSEEFTEHVVRAVQLINTALPYDQRMLLSSVPAPPLTAIQDIPDGEVFVDFAPSAEDWNLANPDYRPGSAAIAENEAVQEFSSAGRRWEYGNMRAGHVWLDSERIMNAAWVPNPDTGESEETVLEDPVSDADPSKVYSKEVVFAIVVHELIHVLGFLAHNDATRFPDSIMRDDYLLVIESLPEIDSEALLAAYGRFRPGTRPEELTAANLGRWDDTSFHLLGELDFPGGAVSFGVAERNGLARPWASGPAPWTNLADDSTLSETVTWDGALLGITPSAETVAGAARLAVELANLDGQLDFTSLETWGVNRTPGAAGSGTTWNDGALGYTIEVRGNTFVQTGGDDGEVTGAFFGATHQAMGGVLERSDLAAGFGGKR